MIIFLILAGSFLFFAHSASAATYYVRADGTATKANAIGPDTSTTTTMSMVAFNAATFSTGDTIYFSDKGGNYSTGMVVPSSGASTSSVITYSNAPGESPVIVTSPGGAGITIGTGKSNVIVTGFTAGQAATGNGNGVIIASTTNITLSYITVPLSHYGINIQGVSPDTIILDHITVVNEDYGYDLYDFATLTTNLTISNCNFAKSIGINNRVSGLTVSSTSAKSLELKGGVTGILNINGLTLSGGTYGLYMASTSILSTGSIIQNTNISGITSHEAFYIIGVTGPLNLLNNTSTNSVDSLNITNSSAITITNFSGSGHTDVNGPDIKVSSSSNIIFNNLSLTGSDKGTALSNEAGSYNIEFNVANISHYVYGVINAGGVHNLSYNNVIVAYIKYLGFMDDQNSGTVHDITYKNSVVHDAGLYFKTHTDVSEQNDGGWAVHYNAYNMYLYNCIAYNNGGSGIGYGNTSSGGVYNSIEYNNGGNWTSTGGINTARSGFYDFQSGAVNTVTGTGWTLKNNIGGGSYPVEVYGSNAGYLFNTVDYNLYYPLNTNNFQNLGGIRSWFSYHVTSGSEPNSTNTNPLFTNATNGDFTLTFLSPAIDSGTTYTGMTSTTTDFLGNPIYGTPDMGAYEYQPPHDLKLSTPDTIDIGAGARIYADGKFRDLSTTTSVSAKLKIAPQGGNFTAYDATTTRPAYLDVTGITWTNSHKVWTEGNAQTSGMITDHTIGDLNANKYYTISVTGASASTISGINGTTCLNAVCQSNGSGVLSFEYNGGYSDHTFNMQEDVTPPSAFDLVSPSDTSGTTNTAPTFSWGASSDIGSGLAKYQLYINGGLYQDNISSSVTSLGISTVSDGTYTWYIKAVDNNGNVTQSSNTYTLHIDSTAPTNVGISSITANSNSQLTILAETAIDTNSGLDNTPYHFAETSGNLGASDSIYQTSTTYIDTGLSTNTQYTYKVKAKDADSNESSYSNTVSKYTLVNNPTNLLSSSNKTSAVLSVDSFPNDTSGSSGYFFLNTNTGSTSNWIQTNSWTDTLVTCGSSYIYSVKYRNGDGTETSSISITKLTDSCATTETMVTTRRNSGGRPFILPFIPVRPANPSTGSGSSTPITTITPSTYNLGTVTLKLGSRGNAVTELQRFLNKTLNIKLTLDGKLGPKTIAIIKQWQKANGLVADGVVGVKTKKLMK